MDTAALSTAFAAERRADVVGGLTRPIADCADDHPRGIGREIPVADQDLALPCSPLLDEGPIPVERDAAQLFTMNLNERAQRKLTLQSHLRHALDRHELSLHYQPKVTAADRSLVGVEVLLRWTSAELGSVGPADFIGIAEESRLILPIGAWVVGEAIRQHAQWKADGYGEIPVSINVSAVQLRNGDLVNTFRDALRRHGVAPSAIELELTESTLMDSEDGTHGQLLALKALGIKVSVDDFGTGYSSLTYLNGFPVDRIKIDRSFIRNMLVNPALVSNLKCNTRVSDGVCACPEPTSS